MSYTHILVIFLSPHNMFISQRDVPGCYRYYVDGKHNNNMASFVVKDLQPLSVLKMLNVQIMHSRSYSGKM
jgi:hypothetical protein